MGRLYSWDALNLVNYVATFSIRLLLFHRVNLLMRLGVPIQNIKVHPQCQSFVSPMMLTKRRVEWGCKVLGSFIL